MQIIVKGKQRFGCTYGQARKTVNKIIYDFDPDWCRKAQPVRCPDCNSSLFEHCKNCGWTGSLITEMIKAQSVRCPDCNYLIRKVCTNCGGQGVIIKPLVILLLMCFSLFASADPVECEIVVNSTTDPLMVLTEPKTFVSGGGQQYLATKNGTGDRPGYLFSISESEVFFGYMPPLGGYIGWQTLPLTNTTYTFNADPRVVYTISGVRAAPVYCTLTFGVNNVLWGSITPFGQFNDVRVGTSWDVSIQPAVGHELEKCTVVDNEGTREFTSTNFGFTVRSSAVITAIFYDEGVSLVHYTVSDDGKGITSPDSGTYTCVSGSSVTVSASPSEGFVFRRWVVTVSGETINFGDNPLSRTLYHDTGFYAEFMVDGSTGGVEDVDNDNDVPTLLTIKSAIDLTNTRLGTFMDSNLTKLDQLHEDNLQSISQLSDLGDRLDTANGHLTTIEGKFVEVVDKLTEISEKLNGTSITSDDPGAIEIESPVLEAPEIQERDNLEIEVHQYEQLKGVINSIPEKLSSDNVPSIEIPLGAIGVNSSFILNFNDGIVGWLRYLVRTAFSVVISLTSVFITLKVLWSTITL